MMIGFMVWACYLTVFGFVGETVLFLRAANEAQRERVNVMWWWGGEVVKGLPYPERFSLMPSLFGVLGPTGRPVLAWPGRARFGCLFLEAPKWATGTSPDARFGASCDLVRYPALPDRAKQATFARRGYLPSVN